MRPSYSGRDELRTSGRERLRQFLITFDRTASIKKPRSVRPSLPVNLLNVAVPIDQIGVPAGRRLGR